MDTQDRQDEVSADQGFTLVEVSLAVLVIGIGLLTIFSLFPSGLRAVEEDAGDTRCGLFAEVVLNGMRGNAMTITNWDDWCYGDFSGEVRSDILGTGDDVSEGSIVGVQFPKGGESWLRYRVTLDTINSNRYSALLEVEDGQYPEGMFVYPSKFYTEFYYQGR